MICFYAASWLKCYRPAGFLIGLLKVQPAKRLVLSTMADPRRETDGCTYALVLAVLGNRSPGPR